MTPTDELKAKKAGELLTIIRKDLEPKIERLIEENTDYQQRIKTLEKEKETRQREIARAEQATRTVQAAIDAFLEAHFPNPPEPDAPGSLARNEGRVFWYYALRHLRNLNQEVYWTRYPIQLFEKEVFRWDNQG